MQEEDVWFDVATKKRRWSRHLGRQRRRPPKPLCRTSGAQGGDGPRAPDVGVGTGRECDRLNVRATLPLCSAKRALNQ